MIKNSVGVALLLSFFIVMSDFCLAQEGQIVPSQKKRDPFVALVNSNGKIKSSDELFPVVQKKPLSMNVLLSAIIWDEERPLAMINNKVYSEGSVIVHGLMLTKINPTSVILNDNGNEVTVPLRKNIKNE